jgi:murein DD-endopeptidase MepM/ murein hydrolase activator NlpD
MKKLFRLLALLLTAGLAIAILTHPKEVEKVSRKAVREAKKIKIPLSLFDHGFHKKPIRKKHFTWKRFFKENPLAYLLIAIGFISVLGSGMVSDYSFQLQTSLVGLPETHFTGTVAPIEKVPNWVALSNAERGMRYEQLPQSKLIPLPEYNTDTFQKGVNYRTASTAERNAYISYPVPNLGNYQLDGTENTGSHTGVDIKVPVGTPVRTMASGIVYKTVNKRTDFGNHIVIAHVDIPDPSNPNQKTTLFSGYAHLDSISVHEGQRVNKGDIIGKSGESGMATAPHLHFQVDRADAPFNLYWPFMWADVTNAGLNSYFDAVYQGIGKENALKYTVHPMNFVAQFKNYVDTSLVASTNDTVDVQLPEPTPVENIKPIVTPPVFTPPVVVTPPSRPTSNKEKVEFQTDRIFIPGEEKVVKIRVENLVATAGIEISSTLGHLADVYPKKLIASDFDNGVAEVRVTTDSESTFKLIANGAFGEIRSSSLRAQFFLDVPATHSSMEAIKYLKNEGIVDGYDDNTFRPKGNLNRAEAVKILLEGNGIVVENVSTNFNDVPRKEWFSGYVATAAKRGIVKGYADGQFKPANKISRAEFLKIAILTAGHKVSEHLAVSPYPDVQGDTWFAPYFAFSKTYGLIGTKRGGYVVPSQPITRAEAAEVMYRLSKIR